MISGTDENGEPLFFHEYRFVDGLSQYNEGPYAYWLAAGFPVDADEEMVKNVITLFCEENLEEMQTEETSFAG